MTVSKNQVKKLRSSVREQALAIETSRLERLREDVQNELKLAESACLSEDQKKHLQSRIEEIQRQIFNVNSLPDEKLCDLSPTALNWQKIAREKVLVIYAFKKAFNDFN